VLVELLATSDGENFNTWAGGLYQSALITLCCAHLLSEDGAVALGAHAAEARLANVFTEAGFSEFKKPGDSANRLGQAVRPARRCDDREQEVGS
jgi:hypothetical protein